MCYEEKIIHNGTGSNFHIDIQLVHFQVVAMSLLGLQGKEPASNRLGKLENVIGILSSSSDVGHQGISLQPRVAGAPGVEITDPEFHVGKSRPSVPPLQDEHLNDVLLRDGNWT